MERLIERFEIARKALARFREALAAPATELNRDASIHRFEYTHEAVWKAAQMYLRKRESLAPASPMAVIRACFQSGILSEEQSRLAVDMARDRNLTVHTYSHLPSYAALMDNWLTAMESTGSTL